MKILDYLCFKIKLPIIITLTVIVTNGLIVPNSILAKNRSPDVVESRFGSYLAGRQAQIDSNLSSAIQYYSSSLNQSPNNVFLLRRIVALLVSYGKVDEAVPKAKQLLNLSSSASNIARLILVLDEIKNKKYIKALTNSNKLRKEGLNTYLIPILKAWILAGQNKNDAALRIIDQKTSRPGLETLHGIQGAMISEFGGNVKDAITRYIKVAKLQKNRNLRAIILLGSLYERHGEKQKAREIYDNYKNQHPGTTELNAAYKRLIKDTSPRPENKMIIDGISEALFSLGSAVKSQDPYQAIIFSRLAVYFRPSFTVAKLMIAGSLEENDNLKDANSIYGTISKDPKYSWEVRLRIANNLDRLGDTDAAIRKLQTMSIEKPRRVDALIKMGDILQRHKRYQASINSYEQAKNKIQNINGEHWPLYFALGISYERIGKWPIAEKNLLKALKLQPNHPSILNYLGYSWVEQGLNLDQAQTMIRMAVKQRPRDGYIIDSLGWALFRLGNIEGAVKQLERAVLIRPEDPTINDHLGDVYWTIGRRNEAIFQWKRALILEPEKDTLKQIKTKIKIGLPKDVHKRKGL